MQRKNHVFRFLYALLPTQPPLFIDMIANKFEVISKSMNLSLHCFLSNCLSIKSNYRSITQIEHFLSFFVNFNRELSIAYSFRLISLINCPAIVSLLPLQFHCALLDQSRLDAFLVQFKVIPAHKLNLLEHFILIYFFHFIFTLHSNLLLVCDN
jgi:hypothetical protein